MICDSWIFELWNMDYELRTWSYGNIKYEIME